MRSTVTIILLGMLGFAGAFAQNTPLAPAGGGAIAAPAPEGNCIAPGEYDRLRQKLTPGQKERTSLSSPFFPSYGWPLEHALHDGLILVNYVDDDTSTAIRDYMGGAHSYDGHNGTDITLFNFRAMDHGTKVIAASSGTVIETEYGKPDRNMGPPYPSTENHVIVQNDDGTYSWYLHFRRNALTVEPGERIERGQVLGLAGSSGRSTGAHLHFETGTYTDDAWNKRDPWNGPSNAFTSLWAMQEPYVDTLPMRVYDMGIYNGAAVGGDIHGITYEGLSQRVTQPAVFGADEQNLALWMQLQSTLGERFTVELLTPDGSVFGAYRDVAVGQINNGWLYWYWPFAGHVTPEQYGMWTARILAHDQVANSVQFAVGPRTIYAPRFWPLGGRSFRVAGLTQYDTLRIASLGGPVTYTLLGAPSGVRLADDSVVVIDGVSNQSNRSFYFQAVATDAARLSDTMWYHLVDPTRPLDGTSAGVADDARAAGGASASFPNPFDGSTTISYALPQAGDVTLRVYDLLGREVAVLVDGREEAGQHSVIWRPDESGSAAYVYRLRGPSIDEARMLLRR